MTELELTSEMMSTMRKAVLTDEALARCVHELHRAYNVWLEDPGPLSPPWDALTPWQKETVISGVRKVRMGALPSVIHQDWVSRMEDDGWVYGPERDPERKTHPSMRDWFSLPVWERRKSIAFCRVIYALTLEEW